MEDRYTVCRNLLPGIHMFGVFDGHGGHQVADTCATHLPDHVKQFFLTNLNANAKAALRRGLEAVDRRAWGAVMESARPPPLRPASAPTAPSAPSLSPALVPESSFSQFEQCGSTACVAVLESDSLTLANVGDSRAVLRTSTGTKQLTRDHKPGSDSERRRILGEGGFVTDVFGIPRVMGMLSLSRALGDWYARPYVSSSPDVIERKLAGDEKYVIIASDGLWDVISNKDAVAIADDMLARRNGSERGGGVSIARALAEEAVRRNSSDNVTVMWIDIGIKQRTDGSE